MLHQRPKVIQSFASRRTVVAFVWVIYPWDTRYRRTTKEQPRCLLFRHYIVLGEPSQTPLSTHGAQQSVVSTVGKHYKPRSSYQRIATEPIRRLLPWHFIMFRVQNRPTLSLLSAGALWEASGSQGSQLRCFSRVCRCTGFLLLLVFACSTRTYYNPTTTTYRDLTARRKSETISPAVSKYARKVYEGVVAAGVVRFVFVAS